MPERKLSKKEFLNLIEIYGINIARKADEYYQKECVINSDWCKSDMSEEELLKASIKYLSLSNDLKKDFKYTGKILIDKIYKLTKRQKNIIKIISEWIKIMKESYKYYSNYLDSRMQEDEADFIKLKEKANGLKSEFLRLIKKLQ